MKLLNVVGIEFIFLYVLESWTLTRTYGDRLFGIPNFFGYKTEFFSFQNWGKTRIIEKEGSRNPQEWAQFSPRSHTRLLMGKRTAQNATTLRTSQATAR